MLIAREYNTKRGSEVATTTFSSAIRIATSQDSFPLANGFRLLVVFYTPKVKSERYSLGAYHGYSKAIPNIQVPTLILRPLELSVDCHGTLWIKHNEQEVFVYNGNDPGNESLIRHLGTPKDFEYVTFEPFWSADHPVGKRISESDSIGACRAHIVTHSPTKFQRSHPPRVDILVEVL